MQLPNYTKVVLPIDCWFQVIQLGKLRQLGREGSGDEESKSAGDDVFVLAMPRVGWGLYAKTLHPFREDEHKL